jgi:iron(III) transport system permease protein
VRDPRHGASPRRLALAWLTAGLAGFALFPWYMQPAGVLGFAWLRDLGAAEHAPALWQAVRHGRPWLAPLGMLLVAGIALTVLRLAPRTLANGLLIVGGIGLAYLMAQGFTIGLRGPVLASLGALLGASTSGQPGMGLGAAVTAAAFAALFAIGLAGRGALGGDAFVAGSIVGIALLIGLFTFYPVLRILLSSIEDARGTLSLSAFAERLFTAKIFGLGCLIGPTRCGVAWNTLLLGVLCATGCTVLGLAFALIVARTRFRFRRALRLVSVLPIITPPFVVGLGVMLVFGRSGLVNQVLEWAFGIPPTRWIYGLQGVLLAQIFAFTPIAFLVLIGVVEGVSPSLEEAAQTLRANPRRTLLDVSLPLMRPGLANAFLISFLESIADFGNPIVLGGNFGVLSTEVFFSVVGAQLDQGRAATLGVVLLAMALGAFLLQRAALGRRAYTTLSGKGDAGLPAPLPHGLRRACYVVAGAWVLLTVVLDVTALAGGFVETWGRDYTPTLRHYAKAFGVEWGSQGLLWTGAAWTSFWTTLRLSAIAAPLTAALGLLAAYLLARQRFPGRAAFEFGTMLSFAIPGTVIGVSYILAFNVPPIEITGTAIILVACNVFRNMPVGVRAGMASIAQVDRSLDEASASLGARGFTVLRTVLLPLLRPALVAALVYSFVRAMTTVSAVIFLVSAQYEWATTYIINRIVNGDYGIAIAYSTVLIALMLVAIVAIHALVGERTLGRRAAPAVGAAAAATTAA